MALSTLAGGHLVTGHSRRFSHHADVKGAGGRLTSSIVETVRDADLVCVNVFSEEQLRDALFANKGLAALRPGAMLAIHSTVSPVLISELTSARPDIDVLDAGFSGSADDAAKGQLTLMVGGQADAVDRAQPVFRCYANTISHLGPSGAGMTLKILNNLLFAAQMNLGREAISIATEHGIAVKDALATLLGGSAASFALGTYQQGPDPLDRFERTRPYMEKDVAIGHAAFPGLRDIKDATRIFVE